jgi:hypothetical protein
MGNRCRGGLENVGIRRPELILDQILQWADAHRKRTGKWPTTRSGPILDAPGNNWLAVDMALRQGHRGLRTGSSLNRLLHERRGVTPRWRVLS